MDADAVKYCAVYCMGSWRNLYRIRIQSYVLVVMTEVDKTYLSLSSRVEDFRVTFLQSRLEIPVEEPPVLLRYFSKRETLAMLYHNIKQGHIIFPQLRPGPDVQQNEILETFWWFFGEAK
jgi:mRNA-degrading endonuclease RelE of RelBE toxin-antitoxin system